VLIQAVRLKYLEEQYERHPLVVADELSVLGDVEPFSGDCLFDGQVVGVADPADGVRVVAMTVRELGRAPAVDRAPDELLGADEEPEADEDDDGLLSTQAVDVVVVHAKPRLANAQHRLEQTIHRAGRTNAQTSTIRRQVVDRRRLEVPLLIALHHADNRYTWGEVTSHICGGNAIAIL